MGKTLLVVGFGPGVSAAVAETFGGAGYSVALVARSADRVAEGAAALRARGVRAAGFPADAGDPEAIREAVRQARAALGPVASIHWNAISGSGPIDLVETPPAEVLTVFGGAVAGLLAAVQEALPDLRAAGDGSVLVTNGAYGDLAPAMDALATAHGAVGVALANAAKNKLVGLLAERLKREGVHVGEVMIAGRVAGTPTGGAAGIPPATIAEQFFRLHRQRDAVRAWVNEPPPRAPR